MLLIGQEKSKTELTAKFSNVGSLAFIKAVSVEWGSVDKNLIRKRETEDAEYRQLFLESTL